MPRNHVDYFQWHFLSANRDIEVENRQNCVNKWWLWNFLYILNLLKYLLQHSRKAYDQIKRHVKHKKTGFGQSNQGFRLLSCFENLRTPVKPEILKRWFYNDIQCNLDLLWRINSNQYSQIFGFFMLYLSLSPFFSFSYNFQFYEMEQWQYCGWKLKSFAFLKKFVSFN